MTIFDDLANALAPYVGGVAVAGMVLAFAFIVTVFICLMLFLSTTSHGSSDMSTTMLISIFIGFIFSAVVGWLPIWVPFLLLIYIAWVLLDPMGSKAHA